MLLSGKTDEPREGGVGRCRSGHHPVRSLDQRRVPTSIDCRNECIGGIAHLIRVESVLRMAAVCSARASCRCHVIANFRGKHLVNYVDVAGLQFHLYIYSLKPDNNRASLWF